MKSCAHQPRPQEAKCSPKDTEKPSSLSRMSRKQEVCQKLVAGSQ